MKKYIVFAGSFSLIFSLFMLLAEVVLGMFIRFAHVPNIKEAWNASAILPQQTEIHSSSSPFLLTLLVVLLSAIVAYFVSDKFTKRI